jgi:hypothetical protein
VARRVRVVESSLGTHRLRERAISAGLVASDIVGARRCHHRLRASHRAHSHVALDARDPQKRARRDLLDEWRSCAKTPRSPAAFRDTLF